VSEQQPDPDDGGAESFADAAIDGTPTVFTAVPQEHSEIPTSVGKRPGRRAGWALALGLGYVVLAAGTAFGVIVDKSPAPVDVTAVNASAYAAPMPSASATASASVAPSPSAAATTASVAAPTPKSTVTGSVSGGVHSGDLRYFLLPPPQGASSVQGNPDGNTDTVDQAITVYGGESSQKSILEQAGFKAACDRVYQDTTIGANVSILLIRFHSSSEASQWLDSFSLTGNGYASISVPGESGAKGWSYAKSGYYTLVGLYREGDTFYEIQLYGQQLIPAPDLGQVISAEHSRLANG
jgi:hypothetical protein